MTFARIRTESGYEASVNRAYAESVGAEILDAPAMNLRGRPLPASRKDGRPVKRRTSVNEEAARRATASSAPAASSPAAPSGGVAANRGLEGGN